MKQPCERPLSRTPLQVSEESRRGEFQGNFFVLYEPFDRRSTLFGVKFIRLYGTVGFIAIRDRFGGESDLWSDVWPAMDGVVSLLTEVSHDAAKMKDLP